MGGYPAGGYRRRPGGRGGKIGGVDLELVGKRAIVTGGSRGIGLAIAKALSAEGAHVALVARDAGALAAAKAAVEEAGGLAAGRVITVSCDTGDDHAVGHMAADVAAAFGGVDILVNAAARPNTGAVVGHRGSSTRTSSPSRST